MEARAIKLIRTLGLSIVMLITRAAMICLLWQWFLVPGLHVPSLSVPQIMGIVILVRILTRQDLVIEEEKLDEVLKYSFFETMVMFVFAAIFYYIM